MIALLELFLNQVFVQKIWIVLLLLFAVFFTLLFLERKNFRFLFKGIDRRYVFLALGIAVFSLALLLVFNNAGGRNYDTVYWAPQMLNGFLDLSRGAQYPPLYPFLASIALLLTGFNYEAIHFVDYSFFFLVPLAVFFSSFLLFKKEKPAILSAFFSVFILHLSLSELAPDNDLSYVAVVMFFLSMFFFFSVASFKLNSKKGYAIALLWIMLTALLKFEFMFLIALFFIGLILFRAKKIIPFRQVFDFTKKKLSLGIVLFLLFFPAYFSFYNLFNSMQVISDESLSILINFTSISQGTMLNLSFFQDGAQSFSVFWLGFPLVFFAVLTALSAIAFFKEHKREIAWLLLVFLSLSFIYMIMKNGYQYRFALFIFPPIALLTGLVLGVLPRLVEYLGVKLDSLALGRIEVIFAVLIAVVLLGFYPAITADIANSRNKVFVLPWQADIVSGLECEDEDMVFVSGKYVRLNFQLATLCRVESLDWFVEGTTIYSDAMSEVSVETGYAKEDFSTFREFVASPAESSKLSGWRNYVLLLSARRLRQGIIKGDYSLQDVIGSREDKQYYFGGSTQHYFILKGSSRNGQDTLHLDELAGIVTDNCELEMLKENEYAALYRITGCI